MKKEGRGSAARFCDTPDHAALPEAMKNNDNTPLIDSRGKAPGALPSYGDKQIETGGIDNAAKGIRTIKKAVVKTLADSKGAVKSLEHAWSGQAARTTIDAYMTFDKKYAAEYASILEEYADFLEGVVSAGYLDTENKCVRLADLI